MLHKLDIIVPAAIFLCLACAGFVKMISAYTWRGRIVGLAYFMPLLGTTILMLSPVWFGLAVGSIVISYSIPMPVLHRLQGGIVVVTAITALMPVRAIMANRRTRIPVRIDSICMIVLGLIVFGRFAYDRPGSAMLGQTGGAGEAFVFCISFLSFFALSRIAAQDWDARLNLKLIVAIAVAMVGLQIMQSLKHGVFITITQLFGPPMWFILPIILCLVLQEVRTKTSGLSGHVQYWTTVALILALAVISPYRSRLMFAIGMVGAISFVYNYITKGLLTALMVLAMVIAVLFVVGEGSLPPMVNRSLSTIIPASRDNILEYSAEYGVSTEVGWTSPFRAELYRLAWIRIRQHPIVGSGFTFTGGDFQSALSATGRDAFIGGLALTGTYHNSLLQLAVFCGIPAVLIFIVVLVTRLSRFVLLTKRMDNTHRKIIAGACLGYFVAMSGQMLMNGGAPQFFYISTMLGVMRGMCEQQTTETPVDTAE